MCGMGTSLRDQLYSLNPSLLIAVGNRTVINSDVALLLMYLVKLVSAQIGDHTRRQLSWG